MISSQVVQVTEPTTKTTACRPSAATMIRIGLHRILSLDVQKICLTTLDCCGTSQSTARQWPGCSFLQRMKNQKLKLQFTIVPFLLAAFIYGCAPATPGDTGGELSTSTPYNVDIPTWTPRPDDLTQTALPTPTLVVPELTATSTPLIATEAATVIATPKTVTVMITDGNLSVRRGPSLAYNYVGVLYNGDTVTATGRDRISRWIRVELPGQPVTEGWITTETQYTDIEGDISNLPFIETEPANPAFIRNCTKTTLWILPDDVQLLDKFNGPYNEEQFNVGLHQVIDPNNPDVSLEEIDLSEGERVDILHDGTGGKSKCE